MLDTEIALTGQLSTPVPLKGKLNGKYIYPDEQDPTVPQWVKDITEEDIEKWNAPDVEETDPTVPEWVKNITEEEINKWNNPEIPQIEEVDPTVPSYVKNITEQNISDWNNKSDFSGNYEDINSKPSINNVELTGNKTLDDLNLYDKETIDTMIDSSIATAITGALESEY